MGGGVNRGAVDRTFRVGIEIEMMSSRWKASLKEISSVWRTGSTMPTSQDEAPNLRSGFPRRTKRNRRPKPATEDPLGFGVFFSDHMLSMDYEEGRGWHRPRIDPYGSLSIDPTALVLHYGQEVFDGLKAFRTKEGTIQIFRPREYLERMNRSAERLCMPTWMWNSC